MMFPSVGLQAGDSGEQFPATRFRTRERSTAGVCASVRFEMMGRGEGLAATVCYASVLNLVLYYYSIIF